MTKKNKVRKSKSLKSPYTEEELETWLRSLPKKAKIRFVKVVPSSFHCVTPPAEYIEAIYWVKKTSSR